jgi:hypothetical protein
MAKDSTGRLKSSTTKQATAKQKTAVNLAAKKAKMSPKSSSETESKPKKAAASPKTEKATAASKGRKGLAPAVAEQAVAASPLKSQVDAELTELDAAARAAGQTTFCQCAVSTKQDVFITALRIRRSACLSFSITHADNYNVAMD